MPEYCKIDLETTINSGQVFLWKKYQSNWYGINGQDILKINDSGEIKSYSNQKIDYFREKDDLEKILRSISIDPTTKKAVKKFFGLRLLRQDPFQCFISFIVSSNSSIQKIKKCLENICKSFGKKVIFDEREFFLFPESKTLAAATFQEVRSCGVGYRSNFIIKASEMVYSNKINFQYLQNCEYIKAKDLISKVPGIGDKVADCILLFSLDKLEAFPLDRWMIRVLGKYYPNTFTLLTKNITHKQYELLHEKIVNHFGPFAGYTQQFLFKMERDNYKKKWL